MALCSITHAQSNGFIVKNNDTIKVQFQMDNLTVRSFGKIEKLQDKVKYKLNDESIIAKPTDISSFCIKQNDRNFYFDSFVSEDGKKGSFLFRLIGKKVDKITVYQFYGSGFAGVNYSVRLGYLVKKEGQKDFMFQASFPKQWKKMLLEIVKDCPIYYNYIDKNVEKFYFEDEFENYLLEYKKRCKL